MERRIYPFTAIVGQDLMRKALILNAVDPSIGGVLIRGIRLKDLLLEAGKVAGQRVEAVSRAASSGFRASWKASRSASSSTTTSRPSPWAR